MPRAATVAGPLPDIAAKKQQTITHTIASPVLLWPTIVLANSISFSDMPACSIIFPAIIKNGIANNENLLDEENTFIGIISIGRSAAITAITLEIPREIAIGILHISNTAKRPNKIPATLMPFSPLSPLI